MGPDSPPSRAPPTGVVKEPVLRRAVIPRVRSASPRRNQYISTGRFGLIRWHTMTTTPAFSATDSRLSAHGRTGAGQTAACRPAPTSRPRRARCVCPVLRILMSSPSPAGDAHCFLQNRTPEVDGGEHASDRCPHPRKTRDRAARKPPRGQTPPVGSVADGPVPRRDEGVPHVPYRVYLDPVTQMGVYADPITHKPIEAAKHGTNVQKASPTEPPTGDGSDGNAPKGKPDSTTDWVSD
ncbi:putative ATP-grasp-modified RiPP [Nonomuraea purpurea]|uniref:ATP-grasp-modified RiPP n=1 Tax=Nonomuraea purpurea TaxID=1849276 RepID=A0ABV8GBT5_9ACTN